MDGGLEQVPHSYSELLRDSGTVFYFTTCLITQSHEVFP